MLAVGRLRVGAGQPLIRGLVVPMMEEHRDESQRVDLRSGRAALRGIDVLQLVESPAAFVADLDRFAFEVALDADLLEVAIACRSRGVCP